MHPIGYISQMKKYDAAGQTSDIQKLLNGTVAGIAVPLQNTVFYNGTNGSYKIVLVSRCIFDL